MIVILDVFNGIADDNDPCARQAVCQFIIDVCNECDSSYHVKLLQILERVSFLIISIIIMILMKNEYVFLNLSCALNKCSLIVFIIFILDIIEAF